MFAILIKDVDGRRSYRYFKEWGNAERAMMHDIDCVKSITQIVHEKHINRMNADKGFYEREETLLDLGGTRFHYAIIDGYFEDDSIDVLKNFVGIR